MATPPPVPAPAGQRQPRRRQVQITERDRTLLCFAAEHRLVLSAQVQALLAISPAAAYARLHTLREAGYLTGDRRLHGQPGWYQISRRGLSAIASALPTPRAVDLSCYGHDVGLGWLWLAADQGAFGPVRRVISERQMRSQDGCRRQREGRFGVRLGGIGPAGRDRLHYPDLILETQSGHRVALELELTTKSRPRREGILAAYGADSHIDAVVYLAAKPAVGQAVRQSASRLGISPLVHVQSVTIGIPEAAGDRAGGRVLRGDRSPARRAAAERVQ